MLLQDRLEEALLLTEKRRKDDDKGNFSNIVMF